MASYPTTRLWDLVRLAALLIRARTRKSDLAEAATGWLRGLTERYQSPDLIINLIARRILFVSSPSLSAHVLAAPPSSETFVEGTMKRKAMAFLAPHALTISHDAEWRTMRVYNEDVLNTHRPHIHQQSFLAHVQKAFEQPITDIQDIRRRMGEVMLAVVFGEGNAPEQLIDDIQELFAEVGLRTALFGSRKTAKRDRFYAVLRGLWRDRLTGGKPSLLAGANAAAGKLENPAPGEDALIEQIPHWMFTFTNSGSDLLARSLTMILEQPAALDRVRKEIELAGDLGRAETIQKLSYLEACLLETGRLFPPAVQTAHRAAHEVHFDGKEIPAGTELLQFFPFNNRDQTRDPLANDFRPERWLDPNDSVHRLYPNLFLSGARACPGRDLILFIDKAALAIILRGSAVRPSDNALSRTPLPFSFPSGCPRFGT